MASYMVKSFARFARRNRIGVRLLLVTAEEVVAGDVDADLGGGLYKQRIARPGAGKSGGFRTVLAHRAGGDVFFLHGFAKNAVGNIDAREARALKELGELLHGLHAGQLAMALDAGELLAVSDDDSA